MSNEQTHSFTVTEDEDGTRIDSYLSKQFKKITRSRIQNFIKNSLVLADGKKIKASHKVKSGEVISITVPAPTPSTVKAEDIPLDIIFEDDSIIVINKPSGLTVHPGAGRTEGTMVGALLGHTKELSSVGGPLRPGIVHRLDKDTSGVIVCAKTDEAHINLINQFKEHEVTKIYTALCYGVPKEKKGTIDIAIGRDPKDRKKISVKGVRTRKATTHYKVIEDYGFLSLLELNIETGRTHQIRVHLKHINHPVIGDQVYGKRNLPQRLDKEVQDKLKGIKRQLLHAGSLAFKHPVTGKSVEFTSPLPVDMDEVLKLLRKK